MGLLSLGKPLHWDQTEKVADHVRSHGIRQLRSIFHRLKGRQHDVLLWGDEVEGIVAQFDDKERRVRLPLRGKEFLEQLAEISKRTVDPDVGGGVWHPEYGRYMLESTPSEPYGGTIRDFLKVEANMALRRKQAAEALGENESFVTVTTYPRLGCKGFTAPEYDPSPGGDISKSLFWPDEAINQHPRFATLTANIRRRRGAKVAMNVPIFRDKNTPVPFHEEFEHEGHPDDPEGGAAALPDHIYLDAMGFGMGNSCLQVTFQARNITEARELYDQLAVVCPIVLALSAASPAFRGYLSDRDARWDVIAGSVDDRPPQERGLEPLTTSRRVISKSRYDSISSYLANSPNNKPEYQDIPLEMDDAIREELMQDGLDEKLASHFAHLFIRDPVVVYEELLDQDDATSTDHFENIQSTNWQTMRFKPPPADSDIGWRVEFRPCEIQFTDFENAAYTIFVVLMTRMMLSFNLNLYMPLSKVDENVATAQERDACRKGVFWFRRLLTDCLPAGSPAVRVPQDASEMIPMSINDIINGKQDVFPGLLPLIEVYLKGMNLEFETRCELSRYLGFISKRASGELLTEAQWMRQFIMSHPDYKHDSVVSESINYDLMKRIDDLAKGNVEEPTLLGRYRTRPAEAAAASS